jgi:transposase
MYSITSWADRSRLGRFRKLSRTLKEHLHGILAYPETRLTSAAIETINSLLQMAKRIARGFRNFHYFHIAAYLKASCLDLQVPTLVRPQHMRRGEMRECLCLVLNLFRLVRTGKDLAARGEAPALKPRGQMGRGNRVETTTAKHTAHLLFGSESLRQEAYPPFRSPLFLGRCGS